jgi:transcriptional regulator with XRE-family HTH domain
MSQILAKLGNRIKVLRKMQGLSQEKLATKAKLHYTYIGAVERGERNLSLQSIEKIAKGLNVSIAELFSFSEKPSTEAGLREEIANLLRNKDVKALERVLKVLKALLEE